jgi:hypothetical protein
MVFKKQYILGTFWLTQVVVQGTESNASCFLFYAATKLGMWKLYTQSQSIAEAIVILQYSLQLCLQSSSALEHRHLFLPKKSLPHLQSPVHGILQCPIVGVVASSQALFQGTEQVIIW